MSKAEADTSYQTECDECGRSMAKTDDGCFKSGEEITWLCDCCIQERIEAGRET